MNCTKAVTHSLIRGAIAAATVVACCVAIGDDDGTPAWESQYWAKISERMGTIGLDGTPELSNELSTGSKLSNYGWSVVLRHRIEQDGDGNPQSRWQAIGLYSVLVPSGRDKLRLRPFGSEEEVFFQSASIGRALSSAGATEWRIREAAPGQYDIRSASGDAWRYDNGLLSGGELATGQRVNVKTIGGAITSISIVEANEESVLLDATYDAAGRVLSITFDSTSVHRFEWDADGFLCKWQRPDGSIVSYAYLHGLLTEIRDRDLPLRRLTWAENPHWRRGDSLWLAPMHLKSDGDWSYGYQASSAGFLITARSRQSEVGSRTVYNPRAGLVTQEAGNETLMAQFRGASNAQELQRITDGHGVVLESFTYDVNGRVASVNRKGQPELRLHYDENGRLLDLEGLKP